MAERASRSANAITDHEEIRRWAESQGGQPARVRRTGRGARKGGDTGIIRIDFPGFSGGQSLEPISWEEWFDAFEKNKLALLVSSDAKKPRFNKLVSRETAAQTRTGARARARKATTKAKRSTKKAKASTSRKKKRSGTRR